MTSVNGLITREALLGAAARRFAVLDIADLGKVRIRSLTELERSQIEASIRDKKGGISTSRMIDLKCRMIVECVVDEHGNTLFTKADIDQLRQQDSKVTNEIVDGIQAHCGWSDDDLEEAEKNSVATPDASSQ